MVQKISVAMPFQYYLKELHYRYSPTCYISSALHGVSPVGGIAEIRLQSLWPVEHLKDFWKEEKVNDCSQDLQLVISHQNHFLSFLEMSFLLIQVFR